MRSADLVRRSGVLVATLLFPLAAAAQDTTAARPAQPLPELSASAELVRSRLRQVGFLDRRDAGQGFFLDEEAIALRAESVRGVTDLMRTIPGVRINTAAFGRAGSVPSTTGMPSFTRPCTTPKVLVDGVTIIPDHSEYWGALTRPSVDRNPAEEFVGQLEQAIHPKDVLAMEFYRRPSEVPQEYGGSQSGCGVVLIWSKRGAG